MARATKTAQRPAKAANAAAGGDRRFLWKALYQAANLEFTSRRALARASHFSHVHLGLVLAGARDLSPALAEALAETLDRWAADCTRAAARLRDAASKVDKADAERAIRVPRDSEGRSAKEQPKSGV